MQWLPVVEGGGGSPLLNVSTIHNFRVVNWFGRETHLKLNCLHQSMAKVEKRDEKSITVRKEEDMPGWYSQVVIKSELADYSSVRGCLVIRPYGYRVWELIQQAFDKQIQAHGVKNAYFPLFIPESFFSREAEHAEGFKPEVAWVSGKGDDGERLAIRPTSETIMYDSYSRWIRSWRDLPLLINQWCNVVRWEIKDVKPFLRSREFLWQEGHCVYETEKERNEATLVYLEEYRKLMEGELAIPILCGEKTEHERFPGADRTFSVEGFMPDGKALQCGTSHDLSQGFAKAFNISFVGRDEKKHIPYQNSWGFSTRLIGAMVMQHGDDKGLVLPPRVAPIQVVIIPILFSDTKDKVLKKAAELKKSLAGLRVELDDRDEYSPGWKFNEWEQRGVPLRIEIGPKDLKKKAVMMVRRDTGEKASVPLTQVKKKANDLLKKIQDSLLKNAWKRIKDSTVKVASWSAFENAIAKRKLILAPFCCEEWCEEEIKDKVPGATSRNIPLGSKKLSGKKCINCGKPALYDVYFSKAY